MSRQRGSTLFELVTILAIGAVLCAIAVPGVRAVRGVFAADAAAERLALVLRDAQARAQAHGGASPRAGHFTIGAATAGRTVVVQLGGCVRCT